MKKLIYILIFGMIFGGNAITTKEFTIPIKTQFKTINIADVSDNLTAEDKKKGGFHLTDDVYVDPVSGDNDVNDGSEENPFYTITHAMSSVVGTEQTPVNIYLADGIYSPSTNGETFPIIFIDYISLIGESSNLTIINAEANENNQLSNIILDNLNLVNIYNCSIINGQYYGLSFGGTSIGDIKNCNFLDTNFGLKLFDYSTVNVINCIFGFNEIYGIGIYTENPILDVSYSLFWENIESDCMENCPGWGNIWTQYELEDDLEILYENPLFIDYENINFNLNENSPCVNTGNPDLLDSDGSRSDIGANFFNNSFCNIEGDLNEDNIVNVLDVVDMVNCILFNNCNSICFDLNEDNQYNVLDILLIVNIIIN